MKHVFTVHSPVTYFCACNVVLHENLNPENVIFLYSSYTPKESIGSLLPSFQEKHKSLWSKILTFNITKKHDSYIDTICTGHDFIAYIDLAHYYQKLLITHRNCHVFHFIEEGTASYLAPQTLQELTRIESQSNFRFESIKSKFRSLLRIFRGYNLKLLAIPYFANAFSSLSGIRFYGFHEDVFPGVPEEKKIILCAKSLQHTAKKSNESQNLSDAVILIEESYFRSYGVNKEHVASCFERSLIWLNNNLNEKQLLVKLRPGQKASDSLWITYLKKYDKAYELISDDEPLEEKLIDSSNCIVLGTVSSLLFYAAVFGHKAFSNYSFIDERPLSSFDYAIYYWNKVSLME